MKYTDEDKSFLLRRMGLNVDDIPPKMTRALYAVIDEAFAAGLSHAKAGDARVFYSAIADTIPTMARAAKPAEDNKE